MKKISYVFLQQNSTLCCWLKSKRIKCDRDTCLFQCLFVQIVFNHGVTAKVFKCFRFFFLYCLYSRSFFFLAALKWCIDSDEFPHSIMKYLVKCPIFYIAWSWSLGCNFEHMVKEVDMSNKLWNCVPFTQKKIITHCTNKFKSNKRRDRERQSKSSTVLYCVAGYGHVLHVPIQFNHFLFARAYCLFLS